MELSDEVMVANGWAALLSGKNALYALALGGGVILHAVNIYITTTILPSIVSDIGGLDYYAWSTTLFVVASIVGSALSAKLLQATGPRGAYAVASLLFATGSLICGYAPSMTAMLVGRFVQGLGGGFLYALAYAVIRLVFPEALRARALGLISAAWGVATLLGPAIGGTFAEKGTWRTAFWSLAPLTLLFGTIAVTSLPRSVADRSQPLALPLVQLTLLTASALLLSAGSVSEHLSWNLAGVGGALVLMVLLGRVETRAISRLLPKGALDAATPLGALYATVALLVIGLQPEIFVPYLLQVLHGQSPLVAGYLAALVAIGWTSASMLSSNWSGSAARRIVIAAPILVLLGLLALAFMLPVNGAGDWAPLIPACGGLLLIGFGFGLGWPHLVASGFRFVPPEEANLAAGAITTVQLFATALGAAAAGMTANFAGITRPGGVAGAANAAFWLFTVFALAPAIGVLTAWRVARALAVDTPHVSSKLRGAEE